MFQMKSLNSLAGQVCATDGEPRTADQLKAQEFALIFAVEECQQQLVALGQATIPVSYEHGAVIALHLGATKMARVERDIARETYLNQPPPRRDANSGIVLPEHADFFE